MGEEEALFIWQDREIRFDVAVAEMSPRRGEFAIDVLDAIEDTKGNNGERGKLVVTNLRLIWSSQKNPRVNLSVGLNCVISVHIHSAFSRIHGGSIQALYVLTRFNASRFEFIFTNLVKASPRHFATVQAVHRAYETTRLFRDIKLRGSIVRERELITLPGEQVYLNMSGVYNLSADQGNLGTMVVTNVRVVWFAHIAENFNVSLPYLQIRSVRVRESKFGKALVIDTAPTSAAYTLGFRVDPEDKLMGLVKELTALHRLFSVNPIFGIEFAVEERPPPLAELRVAQKPDDVEEAEPETSDAFAAYYADGAKSADRTPVFHPPLGLAIEKVLDGLTLEQLWTVS